MNKFYNFIINLYATGYSLYLFPYSPIVLKIYILLYKFSTDPLSHHGPDKAHISSFQLEVRYGNVPKIDDRKTWTRTFTIRN